MLHDSSGFTLVAHPQEFAGNVNDFIARIPSGLADRQALLHTLARELHFPQYFGHNWDALYDLLCDLSWIPARRVVVVHNELPIGIGAKSLQVYLEILRDAVKGWQPREAHELVVVFPSASRETIHTIFRIAGS